jgi:hypothetical protein
MLNRYPKTLVLVCLVSLAVLEAGCFSRLFPRRQLKDVKPERVVGTWDALPSTSKRFLTYPVSAGTVSTIEFSSGGRCLLHAFINNGDLFSGEGTWRLTTLTDLYDSATILEIMLPNSEGGRPHVFDYFFSRLRGNLVFWEYLGDPDAAEYIEYERERSP